MLRIMIVDESTGRATALAEALRNAGYGVVAQLSTCENLQARVLEIQPDVIVIDMDSPDRDTLEHMCCIGRDLPLVMFTHDGDEEKIRLAMHAGVSAYIVNGLSSERIKPIIDVAIARFQVFQSLRADLAEANSALAERKLIERAKGLVMKQRQCSEEEAYQALRKLAMTRNLRMVEMAKTVIAAAELLI